MRLLIAFRFPFCSLKSFSQCRLTELVREFGAGSAPRMKPAAQAQQFNAWAQRVQTTLGKVDMARIIASPGLARLMHEWVGP